ncbi:MAG: hypothetical protein Kow0037_25670 [Calditrichia bacterium]
MFSDLLSTLHFGYIFVAAIFFLAGIYSAPHAAEKQINWLFAYPRWVLIIMNRFIEKRWGFFPLFLVIFSLNNLSLFSGLLSGYLIVLPLVISFFTGFHVAAISYELEGWKGVWQTLVNPIAWLEFPAAWISFGMGLKLSVAILLNKNWAAASSQLSLLLPLYLKYCIGLLLIAGLLESALIVLARKLDEK